MIKIISKTPIKFSARKKDLVPGTELTPGQYISKATKLEVVVSVERGFNDLNPLFVSRYKLVDKEEGELIYNAEGAMVLRRNDCNPMACYDLHWLNELPTNSFFEELEEYEK